MKTCHQFEMFRSRLRVAGCTMQCVAQYTYPENPDFGMETWWVTPPAGKTRVFLVKLMGEDGYVLFLPVKGNSIDADIAAVLS